MLRKLAHAFVIVAAHAALLIASHHIAEAVFGLVRDELIVNTIEAGAARVAAARP